MSSRKRSSNSNKKRKRSATTARKKAVSAGKTSGKRSSGGKKSGGSKKSVGSKKSSGSRKTGGGKKALALILIMLLLLGVIVYVHHDMSSSSQQEVTQDTDQIPDYIQVELLDVNSYSRPGIALKEVNGIVIHYTANPGSSAQDNRDYFNGLATTHTTKASAHFIVGLDGEVIQCIPTKEIAYCSNDRNWDTLSIECCYSNADGSFNKKTYDSLVKLTAWLCDKYGISADSVIRHYDVTGKLCPIYYVNHPDQWEELKQDIADAM